jgi:cardiolipin synthase
LVNENWAENLVSGHRVLPVLLADLAAAQSEIHISIFLFFNDPIGQEIERVLCERAHAGVTVRVLINFAKTSMGDPFSTGEQQMMEEDPGFEQDAMDVDALGKRLTAAGVHVHDSNLDFDREPPTQDPELLEQARLIKETSRMDAAHIDHRKLVIVDGRIAFIGSANFGAQYLFHHAFDPKVEAHEEAKLGRKQHHPEPWWKWHDGLVRFEGPVALEVDKYFRQRWVLDGGEDYGRMRTVSTDSSPRGVRVDRVEIFHNQPDSTPNAVRHAFLRAIAEAREEIFIENPYLYHPEIIAALLEAKRSHRSMRVQLIVPALKWNDNEFSQDAMQHHYRTLIRAGIEVFEYQNHFTHLKIAVFDGHYSIVGSANLNFRSLENDCDFELIGRVEGHAFAQMLLREVRDADLEVSVPMHRRRLGLRMRWRDPRTLILVGRRLL